MDDLFSLVILAGVVWSVIAGALGKKGKGTPPAPGRVPRPRPGARSERWGRDEYATGDSADSDRDAVPVSARSRREEERTAAEMVPDDLWAILTGERRPPARVPDAERESERWGSTAWDDADGTPEESSGVRGRGWSAEDDVEEPGATVLVPASYEEARSIEALPPPSRPVVVSLETPPPPPEVRHRAFHERLGRRAAEADPAGRRGVSSGSRALHRALGGRRELQRAIVLREVLGPPKGLE